MKTIISILFLSTILQVNCQSFFENSKSFNKKRTIGVTTANLLNWTGSIGSLYFVWYKNLPKVKFHTFNDATEWQQMDKMGHITVAYNYARAAGDLYQWSGISNKTSSLIGGGYAFGYMLTFEVLDAYNEEWGFSMYDLAANTTGLALYTIQDYFWDEQFIKPKFSSHQSGLSHYRPNILGSSKLENLLKDYNGQTYWMSFNPITMVNNDSKFPKWLNISVGYGINNQLIGEGGTFITTNGNEQLSFTPYRQYYLSLDIDWEKFNVKSPALKLLFRGLNIIKTPLPTIEISRNGIKGYAFYF